MDNEEEGVLLGVENYKQDLKEEIRLVEAQNPGTAQDDKLGHDLEQNQPVKKPLDYIMCEFTPSFLENRRLC